MKYDLISFGAIFFCGLALAPAAAHAVQAREADDAAGTASLVAFLGVAATQVVFWSVTFPVNRSTQNWTLAPSDWMKLRRRWEYSHATSAVFNLLAFGAALLAVLWSR